MPHCTKCGALIKEGAAFCSSCGQSQSSAGGAAPPANPGGGTQSGLQENVAGLLCYVLGWLTGIIFFLIDKRPAVRFHAAQSIVVFGGLFVIRMILGMIWGFSFFGGDWVFSFSIGLMLFWIIGLVTLVLWILLMIKAYQGERFKVPIAGDLAEKLAAKQI